MTLEPEIKNRVEQMDLKEAVNRLLDIFETTEEKTEGSRFRPVTINSVRVLLTMELNHLLPHLRKLAEGDDDQ